MERYELKKDKKLFCVAAQSFPTGIIEAFQTLENLDPSVIGRHFYGISIENKKGEITYKAAVEESFEGEGKKYGCETFVITKGEYMTETIFNFMNSINIIPDTFQKLLSSPGLDKNFPCVEWYKSNEELICMVRINRSQK